MNYASGAARAEEVVAEVKAAGGEAVAIGGSVSKARCAPQPLRCLVLTVLGTPQREEVAKLFSDAMAAYGKVDILVNNAGTPLRRLSSLGWLMLTRPRRHHARHAADAHEAGAVAGGD